MKHVPVPMFDIRLVLMNNYSLDSVIPYFHDPPLRVSVNPWFRNSSLRAFRASVYPHSLDPYFRDSFFLEEYVFLYSIRLNLRGFVNPFIRSYAACFRISVNPLFRYSAAMQLLRSSVYPWFRESPILRMRPSLRHKEV